jgi:methyl-accepting chemotaxis protein
MRPFAYLESGPAVRAAAIAYVFISLALLSFASFTFFSIDKQIISGWDSTSVQIMAYAIPALWIFHLVGMGFVYLLVRKCRHCRMGPATRINAAIEKMSKGDLGWKITLRRGDELAEVADSISTASSALAERVGKIQGQTRELVEIEEYMLDSLVGEQHFNPNFLRALRKLKICTNRLSTNIEEFQLSSVKPAKQADQTVIDNSPTKSKKQLV